MRHTTLLFLLCLLMAGLYAFLFRGAGTGINLLLFDQVEQRHGSSLNSDPAGAMVQPDRQ